MLTATPTPRAVMDARWSARREALHDARSTQPAPRPNNVRAVLDLGNMVYFEFRGRAYGVPPLPYHDGERMLDVWLTVRNYGDQITDETFVPYFRGLRALTKLMWRNSRPCTPGRRALKFLGLARNPYRGANETEIAQMVLFFLGLRTKLTGSFRPGPAALQTL